MREEFKMLSPSRLKPNELNPRGLEEELISALSTSIKEVGLLQSLVVTPNKERPDFYTIILGEQRWRAASCNGECELPCHVIYDVGEKEQILMMLTENQLRKSFTPAEFGQLVDRLQEIGMSLNEISERLGFSKMTLNAYTKIHKKASPLIKKLLAPAVCGKVPSGKLGRRAAQAIVEADIPASKKDEIARRQTERRLPTKTLEATLKVFKDEIPTLEVDEVFQKAVGLEEDTDIERWRGGIEHEKMKKFMGSYLRGKGFDTDTEVKVGKRRADVAGIKEDTLFLVECNALAEELNKASMRLEGYGKITALALPAKIIGRFNFVFLVDGEGKRIPLQLPIQSTTSP